jgi:hypothetical protein
MEVKLSSETLVHIPTARRYASRWQHSYFSEQWNLGLIWNIPKSKISCCFLNINQCLIIYSVVELWACKMKSLSIYHTDCIRVNIIYLYLHVILKQTENPDAILKRTLNCTRFIMIRNIFHSRAVTCVYSDWPSAQVYMHRVQSNFICSGM